MNGATFTVGAVDLWRVVGNAALAAADPKAEVLRILAAVQVTIGEPDESGKTTITTAGTDRYMLLSDTCEAIGVTESLTFVLPVAEWATLDRLLKSAKTGTYVIATVEAPDEYNQRVRWELPDGTAVVTRCQDGNFPKWRSLMPDESVPLDLVSPVALNPVFMARLAKCRGHGGGAGSHVAVHVAVQAGTYRLGIRDGHHHAGTAGGLTGPLVHRRTSRWAGESVRLAGDEGRQRNGRSRIVPHMRRGG